MAVVPHIFLLTLVKPALEDLGSPFLATKPHYCMSAGHCDDALNYHRTEPRCATLGLGVRVRLLRIFTTL